MSIQLLSNIDTGTKCQLILQAI